MPSMRAGSSSSAVTRSRSASVDPGTSVKGARAESPAPAWALATTASARPSAAVARTSASVPAAPNAFGQRVSCGSRRTRKAHANYREVPTETEKERHNDPEVQPAIDRRPTPRAPQGQAQLRVRVALDLEATDTESAERSFTAFVDAGRGTVRRYQDDRFGRREVQCVNGFADTPALVE